ncbi:hypothetical protein SPACI_013930 [Sporomusa acidovorans DSM 3132]|uniref:Uncharacterized protein n=1 Tax=Sporomusa acidovorans (strain ATCC 49682 / DSM 3132 / Mol) TaxID=1123286 RepID=A0ABZ3IZ61_SPOA4|nr:hypothetical protein SPACI_35070 [Sporomusa acidovorans DSM 3132]SDF19450.1 hypothetical protein SAMN04488499_10373 [Sporomusa acidovorans]
MDHINLCLSVKVIKTSMYIENRQQRPLPVFYFMIVLRKVNL